ncbi:hypothetical protein Glove_750g9 [Diversispora epigaea]|uniref:Uncharacterized protein n=1 Tax=Diversispora epigaea TaxID=1348612 RepID=A0A397G7Z2_9GLOM|nr:hypothetical protein Glove_750g9 [Diversispora epigaea]
MKGRSQENQFKKEGLSSVMKIMKGFQSRLDDTWTQKFAAKNDRELYTSYRTVKLKCIVRQSRLSNFK